MVTVIILPLLVALLAAVKVVKQTSAETAEVRPGLTLLVFLVVMAVTGIITALAAAALVDILAAVALGVAPAALPKMEHPELAVLVVAEPLAQTHRTGKAAVVVALVCMVKALLVQVERLAQKAQTSPARADRAEQTVG